MRIAVIARYEEPVSWVHDLDGWVPFVVQKGAQLANEGREASSFFWALSVLAGQVTNVDQLCFLQGDPFGHGFKLGDLVDDVSGFRWLGDPVACDGAGEPHHGGLDVAAGYEMLTGNQFPGSIEFAPGAQFRVDGVDISRFGPDTYRRLQLWSCAGENPWVMERLWGALFG